MNLDFLCQSGARLDNAGMVTDFGNPAGELAAAEQTILAPLTHLALLQISGEDALSFLQNQLTSDVKRVGDNAAQHAAWCSAKGRMLASFILLRVESGYQAWLSADLVEFIQKRLQMYVLRSKVTIENRSEDSLVIGLSGAQSETALQAAGLPVPEAILETAPFADGRVIRIDAQRFALIVSAKAAQGIWQTLSTKAMPVGLPVWQWLEVDAGTILITEATREEFVPQMAGFDRIGGVSFSKGCYPGQEVVARTRYLGKVKRHLYRLHAESAMRAGQILCSPDQPETVCGTIVNAAASPAGGFDALAVIQESFAEAGRLFLTTPKGAETRVIALVFEELPASQ